MEASDDARFVAAMEQAAVATRSEINDADYAVYRKAFARMPIDNFEQALQACWELPRFPTVGQVRANQPRVETVDETLVRRSGGRLVGQAGSIAAITGATEPVSYRSTDEIEAAIDAIDDDELMYVFRSNTWITRYLSEEQRINSAKYGVRMFRRNPNGMYRLLVREHVERELAIG